MARTIISDGDIKLDPAVGSEVIIEGNSSTTGVSTVVDTTSFEVNDPILQINQGESGAGVSTGTSGFQVKRGSLFDMLFVFDESDDTIKPTINSVLINMNAAEPTASANVATKNYVDNLSQIQTLNTSIVITDTGSDGTITFTNDGSVSGVIDSAGDWDFQDGNLLTTGTITGGTITIPSITTDDITIVDNTITTTLTNSNLELNSAGTGTLELLTNTNITGTLTATGAIQGGASSGFGIAPTDGTLHVHTATAGAVTANTNADDLVVENSGNAGISLMSPDASVTSFYFTNPTTTGSFSGELSQHHSGGVMTLASAVIGHSLVLKADNAVTNLTLSGASGSELGAFVKDVTVGGNLQALTAGVGITQTDGTLHVHTATAGAVAANTAADDLVIENSTSAGWSVLGPDASALYGFFGGPSGSAGAGFAYEQSAATFTVGTRTVGQSTVLVGDNVIPNLTLSGAAGSETATFSGSIITDQLIIEDNKISSVNSNADIQLTPAGTGIVEIDSNMEIGNNALITTSGILNVASAAGSVTQIDGSNFTVDDGVVAITGDLTVDNININGNTIDATSGSLILDGTASDEIAINNAGADVNTRIAASGATNAFFVEGSTGNIGLGTATPNADTILDMSSATNAMWVPTGTHGEQPTGSAGMMRFNTDVNTMEFKTSSAWEQMAGLTPASISAGDSSVSVVDGGTGTITLNADGTTATFTAAAGLTIANITGAASVLTVQTDLTVNGDFICNGINATASNLTVEDPIILLASGNTGDIELDAGIMIERGSAGNNAVMYFDDVTDNFKFVTTTSTASAVSIVDTAFADVKAETFTATTFTGALAGNASTASAWATTRTIGMSGDVSSDAVNIDGSGNITITNTVVANDSHTHDMANLTGTVYAAGSGASLTAITAANISTGSLADGVNVHASATATSSNYKVTFSGTTGDVSGNIDTLIDSGTGEFTYNPSTNVLTVGTVTATNLGGTLSTATQNSVTTMTGLTTTGTITSGTWSGSFGAVSGANLTNITAANIDAGTITATLTGDVTGNVSGTAATVTGAAQTNITSVGTLTALTTSGAINTTSSASVINTISASALSGTAYLDIKSTNVTTRGETGIRFYDNTNVGAQMVMDETTQDLEFWSGATLTRRWMIEDTGAFVPTGAMDIGLSGTKVNVGYFTTVTATYADIAEKYEMDADYESGTVMIFGGDKELTQSVSSNDHKVAGVISTNPGFVMNEDASNQSDAYKPLALTGRVPCKVVGKVRKGDLMTTSNFKGAAMANNIARVGSVIGKALEDHDGPMDTPGVIEVVVGLH